MGKISNINLLFDNLKNEPIKVKNLRKTRNLDGTLSYNVDIQNKNALLPIRNLISEKEKKNWEKELKVEDLANILLYPTKVKYDISVLHGDEYDEDSSTIFSTYITMDDHIIREK